MDDSTLATRKDAANRDKQYDLRTLVNHQISERICTPGLGLEYTWFGVISICHIACSSDYLSGKKMQRAVVSRAFPPLRR